MTPGRFITLEGGEGAGKTTQAELLAETLTNQGCTVLRTREPGGTAGAELLRDILLQGAIDWSAKAETLLHFAARAEHVAKTIDPALVRGDWVICDRFYDSTMAYQGFGLGADRAFIDAQIRLLGRRPDLTLILDVTSATAAERTRQRGGGGDRYERRGPAFHDRVREGFRVIAADDPARCVLLDAALGIDAVQALVVKALFKRFGPVWSTEA